MSAHVSYRVRDEDGRLIGLLSYPRYHLLRVGDHVGLAAERRRVVSASADEEGVVELRTVPEPSADEPYG